MSSAFIGVILAVSALISLPDTTIRVSGDVESMGALYVPDSAFEGYDKYSYKSNNYLKLEIQSQRFDAGIQAEYYPEPLLGYPAQLKGFSFPFFYANYHHKGMSITTGSFYEQFGSGLLLRAWEDRALGINNAITGVKGVFEQKDGLVKFSLMSGKPRCYLNPLPSGSLVSGCDASLDLTRLFSMSAVGIILGGSMIDKYENKEQQDAISLLAAAYGFSLPENVLSFSGRLSISSKHSTTRFEYVRKGPDFHEDKNYMQSNDFSLKSGNALLLESDYTGRNLSFSLSLRRVLNMAQNIFRSQEGMTITNSLNYIPALCQRHTYMLANLHPYSSSADGEEGGQADIHYSFRKGSMLGGRDGMKLHVNASVFMTLPDALSNWETARLAWREVTADLEKKWSRRVTTTIFFSIQELSPTHGERFRTEAQNVFVIENLYKIKNSLSLRTEIQYLYSKDWDRDWIAGLVELSIAPYWCIYVSDMYNHGTTGIHYYNSGFSFSKGNVRIDAAYGRHKEGLICSGGICRMQPEYTGGVIRLNLKF